MKHLLFLFILLCLITSNQSVYADELVAWNSTKGITRFEESKHKVDFYTLSNHFETQSNGLFCGPTTATIVLNALRLGKSKNLPKDSSVLTTSERKNLPAKMDPTLEKYTQKNIFKVKGAKPLEWVLGKKVKEKRDFGFQLRQLNELLSAHHLKSTLRIADGTLSDEQIKKELITNLSTPNDYVIINYQRKAIGQEGGGHISPLAAYHEKSDSFLILDVNPNRAKWIWASSKDLIKSMRTFDTVENRGYLLVSDSN